MSGECRRLIIAVPPRHLGAIGHGKASEIHRPTLTSWRRGHDPPSDDLQERFGLGGDAELPRGDEFQLTDHHRIFDRYGAQQPTLDFFGDDGAPVYRATEARDHEVLGRGKRVELHDRAKHYSQLSGDRVDLRPRGVPRPRQDEREILQGPKRETVQLGA